MHFALLGMGEDGHVGSIFPNSDEEFTNSSVIITKNKYNGFRRFSLSIGVINQIECNVLMINNSQKRRLSYKKEVMSTQLIELKILLFLLIKS